MKKTINVERQRHEHFQSYKMMTKTWLELIKSLWCKHQREWFLSEQVKDDKQQRPIECAECNKTTKTAEWSRWVNVRNETSETNKKM